MRFLLIFFLLPSWLYSCTTFCLNTQQGPVFGKNYDWNVGHGMVIANQRNVSKISSLDPELHPARWISKYGSVTFNQYGREFPSGGMNEKGLVIELMWLQDAKYPEISQVPHVGVLEWIQYQLDLSATISDVISNSKKTVIASQTPLHYLVCDSTGACTTIEFLDGKLIPHYGDDLPAKVLTNDTYQNSVNYLREHEGFGGTKQPGSSPSSLDRFVRAAAHLKNYRQHQGTPVNYAFQILDNVANPGSTQWSIVYQMKDLEIHFRTATNHKVKRIRFNRLQFDCGKPVQISDIDLDREGDISSEFKPYQYELNRQLITKAYSETPFLKSVTSEEIAQTARHPETMKCAK